MSEQALMVMENSYPRSLRTLVSRLVGFSCNTFRVEPQGANANATAGSKISFSCPSNALINLRSITLMLNWVTASGVEGTSPAGISGVLPRASDLFEQVNIYLNGVALTNSVQQFNTLTRMMALQGDSFERSITSGCLEAHDTQSSVINGAGATLGKGQSRAMAFNNILGLPSQSSTRYLDCSLFGDLRIEFVVASNAVLMATSVATAADCVNPSLPTSVTTKPVLTLKNFHLELEAIQVANGMYSELQRAKIAQQDFIQINYKDYYTLEADGGSSTSNSTRFSCSSQSCDALYATQRQQNYVNGFDSAGGGFGSWCFPQRPTQTAGVNPDNDDFKDGFCPHYFAFRSFKRETGAPTAFGPGLGAVGPWPTNGPGTPLYRPTYYYDDVDPMVNNWSVQFRANGVAHPQIPASELSSWKNTNLYQNKQKWNTPGNGISSIWNYNYGQYLACARLSMEDDTHSEMECARIKGFDSRGINSDFQVLHQNMQEHNVPTDAYGLKSVFVVVACTASIRAGAGKSIARIP